MPVFPRRNLKQIPIPVVPRNLQIVNPDGTVTRSGQLLLEQLQAVAGAGVGVFGPFIRTLDLVDLTPGTAIAPFVPVYQAGPGSRAIGVLRKEITEDLEIAISRNAETSPLFTFTLPASTDIGEAVTLDISDVTFADLDVLRPDILASDSSADVNGVATLTIEWNPAEVPEEGLIAGPPGDTGPPGMAWQGGWDAGTTYAKDDTIQHDGSTYISLQPDNTGHDPATEGDWWALVAESGTPGPPAPLAVGFVINGGGVGVNVGPVLRAPRAGSFTQCVVTVKASDPTFALSFTIRQNGTFIFSSAPGLAAGTAAGTISTFTGLTTSPLPVAVDDLFTIDIASGTVSWQFTAQLE